MSFLQLLKSTFTPTSAMGTSESSLQLNKVDDLVGHSGNNSFSSASSSMAGANSSDHNSDKHEDDEMVEDVELAPLVTTSDEDELSLQKSSTSSSSPTNNGIEWFIRNTKKNAKVLSACSFYSFCSVSMVLVNKSLASRYDYDEFNSYHNAKE